MQQLLQLVKVQLVNRSITLLLSPVDIVSYRTATKQSVKDILLYSLGNHLQLFTPPQKQEIAQQNKQLDDDERLLLKEVVLERLGITL